MSKRMELMQQSGKIFWLLHSGSALLLHHGRSDQNYHYR
jgi:hypothetical protein